jgi:flagellar hook-associated protein 3 FlgL
MRISTSQIYGTGVLGIERNQNELLKLQNQISSGRRMLTPADDPIASAKALTVAQSREVAAQYARNQGDASDRLGLVDSQLSALTDVLQSVRERAVQAGNTVLADSDRQAIASELEVRLEEMLGIANGRSAEGDYLFSGYQGNTQPFVRSPAAAPPGTLSVSHSGDDGERLLQVGASRQMAVNVTGSDLFMNVRAGNGIFSTAASGNAGSPNQGSGIVEAGSVLDHQKWQSALNSFPWNGPSNRELQVRFSAPGFYRLFDMSTPGGPTDVSGADIPFASGQVIPLVTTLPAADFGAQVVINGAPAAGDTFTITPSTNKSVFQTMQDLIDLLHAPIGSPAARTAFSGQLGGHLTNLDQAMANVSRVHASVGARMQELDALSSNAAAVDIQYQQTLSELQDLDYVKAISDFTRQQVSLEAAQKSFVQISGLSLFNYI